MRANKKKLWFDFDNSPHVLFFKPIIKELEKSGYSTIITARDAFQVRELLDTFHLKGEIIGKHYGKNRIMKLLGVVYRGLQLCPLIWKEKPILAIAHGSRSQLITANILNIKSLMIYDYEYATRLPFFDPTFTLTPALIPRDKIPFSDEKVLSYPGIKEDVYINNLIPDENIFKELRIEKNESDIIVTIRPPATEAHYHNPESEAIFTGILNYLLDISNTKMILLPRNDKQKKYITESWHSAFSNQRIFIPDKAVDGLNLIWQSDLVISGGGTMNREAAALNVPVYSIFRGTKGSIDRYLAEKNRLTFIENMDDIKGKIKVVKRIIPSQVDFTESGAFQSILNHIKEIVNQNSK